MPFQEIVRSPVYLQVAEQLREAILAGRLAPGEELPTERELSHSFGVSRASVREALRALQAQGLVTRGGAPGRAVVAGEVAAPAGLEEAREALAQMSGEMTIEAFDEADVRFHVALVRASGNEAMHLVMLALRRAVARHLLEALRAQRDRRATLGRLTREHAAILKAVEAGNADRAAALVDRHIRGFYLG